MMYRSMQQGTLAEKTIRLTGRIGGLLITQALVFALLIFQAAATQATESTLASDSKCTKCHSRALRKSLENGEKLSLQVTAALFEQSVHRDIGCTGCHQGIAKGKHPSKKPISSARDYSLAQNRVCKNCHQAIFDAYEQSVHGEAAANGNVIRDSNIQAPICSDCHRAHEVTPVALNEHLMTATACLDCHDGARQAHEAWLPNAGMHLDAVSCPACHTPAAERRIDLQLYDRQAQAPVGQSQDHAAIAERVAEIDAAGSALNSADLWQLVHRNGQSTDVTLHGRMEVTNGADAHRLSARTMAVRSCESCHQRNSEAFQKVTVSISGPDGRKQRLDANSEVLSSVTSVDSMGEFYAPGGTRIRLLDGLLVLAVVGALAIPVGHMTLGKILRSMK